MNVLFICSRNKWRSRTAATIYKDDKDNQERSEGTEPGARVRVTAKIINWADIIFVMEKRHIHRLTENFPEEMQNKKAAVLDIADEYNYMDTELVDSIKVFVSAYLHNAKN